MPAVKIMVGIPTYARTYKLGNQNNHSFYANATDVGPGKDGKVPFKWTCKFIKNETAKEVFTKQIGEPYAYRKFTWVSYDDMESVCEKVRWIKHNHFGGVMTYTLTDDDSEELVGLEKYPLHSLINKIATSRE
uniref:Chitinase domain n=1 Tax=Argas monolakensis TaxID=34602 RepID=Q09JW9_ARGMO|nr:chitinase domain [Argas monolakensis]